MDDNKGSILNVNGSSVLKIEWHVPRQELKRSSGNFWKPNFALLTVPARLLSKMLVWISTFAPLA
jgi:hypothetical protein